MIFIEPDYKFVKKKVRPIFIFRKSFELLKKNPPPSNVTKL